MRLVVMGTGNFIVPSFRTLLESEQETVGLITMPKRLRGRGSSSKVFPVRDLAMEFGVPVYEPENVNSDEGLDILRLLAPDLIFICDYGKILSEAVLRVPVYGGLNLHGSLLPAWRGAAPVNRAILAGDRILGVSVLHLEPQVDAGPIVATASYSPSDEETAVEIEECLAKMGAPLVLDSIRKLEQGTLTACAQNPQLVSRAPKLRKEEGQLDWRRTSRAIVDQYRGLQPWPKTFTTWSRRGSGPDRETTLILGPFQEEGGLSDREQEREPGTVLEASRDRLIIRTGDGKIRVLGVQPAGKRLLSTGEFLRGYGLVAGERLGSDT